MSQENVELVRRFIEVINGGGLHSTLDEFCDPNVELRAVARLPDPGRVLRGREAIKAYAQHFGTFEDRLKVEEFIDAGDAVVAVARLIVDRGIAAGLTNRAVEVFGMREGKITYFDAYRTKREALEAAGLEE